MKKILLSIVAALGISLSATAQFTVEGAAPAGSVPGNNDVDAVLTGAGLTTFFVDAEGMDDFDLIFGTAGTLDLFFLGSESGFENQLLVNGLSIFTETNGGGSGGVTANPFVSDPIGLPFIINAGDGLSDLGLTFLASGGSFNTPPGAPILGPNAALFVNPNGGNQFAVGFGDGTGDNDFDDFVFGGTFTSAIPEPSTWLMMIVGFAVVGLQMRRRNRQAFDLA